MTEQNKVNIQQPTQKLNLIQRFRKWLNGENYVPPSRKELLEAEEIESESKESAQEDSEGDGLMSEGDIMFPEEIEA